jgi:hypothetical protein
MSFGRPTRLFGRGDRHDCTRRIIGDLTAELFLKAHYQVDRIEALCRQVIAKI